MKEYLVTVDCIQWGRYYIVSANNAKEAVDKVYDSHFAWRKKQDRAEGYEPVFKKELRAKSTEKLHEEYGEVIDFD